eukprot:9404-Heterococcus_DN1.PRE.1
MALSSLDADCRSDLCNSKSTQSKPSVLQFDGVITACCSIEQHCRTMIVSKVGAVGSSACKHKQAAMSRGIMSLLLCDYYGIMYPVEMVSCSLHSDNVQDRGELPQLTLAITNGGVTISVLLNGGAVHATVVILLANTGCDSVMSVSLPPCYAR